MSIISEFNAQLNVCALNSQKVLTVQKMHVMISVINAQGGCFMHTRLLKDKRQALNLSQLEVAKRAGIERSYYTKIENGLLPTVRVAKGIGKALSIDWLVFFE